MIRRNLRLFILVWVVVAPTLAPLISWAAAVTAGELSRWADGPVRWLLLPDERKELKRLIDRGEESDFIERFWLRRDPQPESAENSYRDLVIQRFDDADTLYMDEAVRGSLTDRGRALILLGPPTHVSVASRPALAWDSGDEGGHKVTTRQVSVEMWGYRSEDLPPGFLEIWQQTKKSADNTLTLTLRFRAETNRTVLIEGESLLEVAAQAAVWQPESD